MFLQFVLTIPLIFSVLIVLSSHSWFSMWFGLELNSMFFILMLFYSKSLNNMEIIMMYFLIQAFSSLMFLFFILMFNNMNYLYFSNFMINIVMFLKLGLVPFQAWALFVCKNMTWSLMMIFLTLQKLNPLYILYKMMSNINLYLIINGLMSSFMLYYQSSLRKLLVISSAVNMSWVMASMSLSMSVMLLYFLGYSISLLLLIFFLNKNKLNYLKDLMSNKLEEESKIVNTLLILNLAGLPPLLGFFLKWIVVSNLSYYNMLLSWVLMLISLMSIVAYLQLLFNSMMMTKSSFMMFHSNYSVFNIMLLFLLVTPLLISIYNFM